mgnify:CR=1 FL=1
MNEVKRYLQRIYKTRYFLLHLVRWDLKYKFRRSKFGLLWTILQPLLLTLIISVVFGFVFKQDMKTYAPYILSGLLVWEIILGAVIQNSSSFMAAETYIRQYMHPIAIYPLRAALVSISVFCIALIGLLIWSIFIYPQNIIVFLITLPLTLFIYFILCWAIGVISSHVHIRYRDYPYVMNLIMQFMWYLSPVFFKESMFELSSVLHMVFVFNPITQVLQLIRKPLLDGKIASFETYIYCLLLVIIIVLISWKVNKRAEPSVIYHF